MWWRGGLHRASNSSRKSMNQYANSALTTPQRTRSPKLLKRNIAIPGPWMGIVDISDESTFASSAHHSRSAIRICWDDYHVEKRHGKARQGVTRRTGGIAVQHLTTGSRSGFFRLGSIPISHTSNCTPETQTQPPQQVTLIMYILHLHLHVQLFPDLPALITSLTYNPF